MSTISFPKTVYTLSRTPSDVSNSNIRTLFIGQQRNDTSPEEVLVKNIQPNGQERTLFGGSSQLSVMINAYRQYDTVNVIDAIPFNSAAGALTAIYNITFSGAPTQSGTLTIAIRSLVNGRVSIAVNTSDSLADIADRFFFALNDFFTVLPISPVYVSPNPHVVIDANGAGLWGNKIFFKEIESVEGLGVTVDQTQVGTGTPVLTSSILDQLNNVRYQTIIIPSDYDLSVMKDFIDARFNSQTGDVEDGIVITTETDTQPNLQNLTNQLDSESMVLIGNDTITRTATNLHFDSTIFEADFVISSYVGAIRNLRLTDNLNIPDLLVGPLLIGNTEGGPRVAAIPYANTPISQIAPTEIDVNWTRAQQQVLNENGVCFLGNNPSNSKMIFGQFVTTSDPQIFLNEVDTSSAIREYFVNNNSARYSQAVLTEGSSSTPYLVNIDAFNTYQLHLYTALSTPPFSLVPSGNASITYFKNNLKTSLNLEIGLITVVMSVPINTQLRGINATVQITFSIN